MRILVTGRTGQVGSELARELVRLGDVHATDHAELDLTCPDEIRSTLGELRPDLVVNAAAYTAVDAAESDPDTALAVNGRAPGVLGEVAARLHIPVVHYSTDYVFDGLKSTPYVEDDRTVPLSVYGRTKRIGELALADSGAAHLTIRVSWVYSHLTGNFLTTMLRLMEERSTLRVVADELGAPTWSREIARATGRMLGCLADPVSHRSPTRLEARVRERSGVYHLAPKGETSWHGFAEAIRDNARASGGWTLRVDELEPIPGAEWESTATRPRNSRLSCSKLEREFGVALPDWREAVAGCLGDMAARHARLTDSFGCIVG